MPEMVENYEFLLLLTDDHGCLHMNKFVEEGKSLKVPLNDSKIVQDLCIWNNRTSVWENGCHFSNGVCKTLLPDFSEDISIKGNQFELKNASHKASGHYMFLNKSGNCMWSMKIFVPSKFVQVLFKVQMLRLGLRGEGGTPWIQLPFFTIPDYPKIMAHS